MATKYYSGNPTTGKEMDGYVFVFEAVDISAGSWYGVYQTDDSGEQAALDKLVGIGQIKNISTDQYEDATKKKAERQSLQPHLKGVSEQQVVDHAEEAPSQSIEDEDDVLEVKQVAKPKTKRKSKKG
jgi:hypothetical protein